MQRNHETPFGGTKFSGVGRDGGSFGLHAYTRVAEHGVARVSARSATGATRASTVTVVPRGRLVYGMQLPVQALSVRIAAPWENDATPADLVRAGAGLRRRRVLLRRGVRPRRGAARTGRR